jgi:hypothetical protein
VLTPEDLFDKYFLPFYPADARKDLRAARAADANPAQNPTILSQIDEIAHIFAELAPRAFGRTDLALDFTDASVHRLGMLLTREVRDTWFVAAGGGPRMIVQVAIHGALYVGACIVRSHGGKWQVRNPLWESLVRLESKAGTADLAVFQWWLKALSDEEIGKGRLVDRYRTHVEVPTFDASSLPVIADGARNIPRLVKVRYDLLYKHLKAHLPELKTVGDDFPSPERFEEYNFSSLDFHLVGGGRTLLLAGAAKDGLHLFWLDATGFQKSAYFPADSFPAPMVKVDGEKLIVLLSRDGKQETHEMLWWGA